MTSLAESLDLLKQAGASLSIRTTEDSFVIYDLSWSRLRGFREIVAELFDPEFVADPVTEISEIEASYAEMGSGSRNEFILGLQWVLNCLKWSRTGRFSSGRITCLSESKEARILRLSLVDQNNQAFRDLERYFEFKFSCSDRVKTVRVFKRPLKWEFEVSDSKTGQSRSAARLQLDYGDMLAESLFSTASCMDLQAVLKQASSLSEDLLDLVYTHHT